MALYEAYIDSLLLNLEIEFEKSLEILESALSQARDPRLKFGSSVVYLGDVSLRICSNFIEAERCSATHGYNRITNMLTEVCGMAKEEVSYSFNKFTYKVLYDESNYYARVHH